MKKFFGCVVLFILVIITLTRTQPVRAGVASHATGKYGTTVTIRLDPNPAHDTSFGFDIEGDIIPIAQVMGQALQDGTITIPEVHPYATFNAAAADKAVPANVKNNIIPFTNDNPVSAKYCVRIAIKPPFMAAPPTAYDVTVSTVEQSEDWQDARVAGQNEELMASWNGRWMKIPGQPAKPSIDPTDNTAPSNVLGDAAVPADKYDFNYPTHLISNIAPADCELQDPAVPVIASSLSQKGAPAQFLPGCPSYGFDCSYYYPWYYNGPPKFTEVCHRNQVTGIKECSLEWQHAGVSFRFDITRKSGDSAFTNLQAKSGRCYAKDTSDPETKAICDQNGQWSSGFVPASVFAGPFDPHAQVEQEVKFTTQNGDSQIATIGKPVTLDTAFKNTHSAMEDTKTAICFNTPASLNNPTSPDYNKMVFGDPNTKDGTVSYAGNCGPTPAACSTTPPSFNSSSCKLVNTSKLLHYPDTGGTISGSDLPPTLIKMIETIGDKIGVPPASILSAMYHEGAFVATQLDPGTYQGGPFSGADQWTEANVQKWVLCGAPMPNCSVSDTTYAKCKNNFGGQCGKAIVGTGEIPAWFWGNGGPNDPWSAVQAIDPARTTQTISPCNLLDSVAAMAKELKQYGQTPLQPPVCYGLPMTSTTPGSCATSTWNDAKIVQSHVGMFVGNIGWCPDGSTPAPPSAGVNSPDPAYACRVLTAYHDFSGGAPYTCPATTPSP